MVSVPNIASHINGQLLKQFPTLKSNINIGEIKKKHQIKVELDCQSIRMIGTIVMKYEHIHHYCVKHEIEKFCRPATLVIHFSPPDF